MGWSRRPVRGARRGMAEPEGACRGKGGEGQATKNRLDGRFFWCSEIRWRNLDGAPGETLTESGRFMQLR